MIGKKKAALIGSIVVLLGGAAGFFVWDNADNFEGDRINNPDRYYADFTDFNGGDTIKKTLAEGDSFTLNAHISKGKVTISIASAGEKTGYKMSNIEEINDYVYTAETSGEYEIKINAKHAAGNIEIEDR